MKRRAITVFLAMVFLAGCGEEQQIDYRIEGVAEETQTESVSGKSAVSQFADETSWSDSWTIEGDKNVTVNVNVEAQVLLPDEEEMCVIEVTVPEFDASFKEHVVETLFGAEEVYYNDAEHLPKKELEKLYTDCKERYENADTESDRQIIQLSLEKYEKLMEDAAEIYTPAESFEGTAYIGEIDGITYELDFSYAYGEAGWDANGQYFNLCATDMEEFRPEEYEDYTAYMPHSYMTCDRYTNVGENACKLSVEEAEQQARKVLEDLGLEYPVLAYARPLIWGDETLSNRTIYDWPANGYVFTYEYGVDDMSLVKYGVNYAYTGMQTGYTVGEQVPYSFGASAEVYVTDKGIINLNVQSPVETVKVSESVELLPLDTIKDIMKDEMWNIYQIYGASSEVNDNYTHLELIYFRVRDTENVRNYSYIPAWRLSDKIGDAMMGSLQIRHPLIINAIDGSWIDGNAEMGPSVFYHFYVE